MFCEQRQQRILEILRTNQAVTVSELQHLFKELQASVRRAFQSMEAE